MDWVPCTKVHARFVFSKHVRPNKTMQSLKSDQSLGDYGTVR